jgi:hypothetical protein
MLYAGVDVSKDKVSVAVLTSGGTKLTSGEFDITTEGLRHTKQASFLVRDKKGKGSP